MAEWRIKEGLFETDFFNVVLVSSRFRLGAYSFDISGSSRRGTILVSLRAYV